MGDYFASGFVLTLALCVPLFLRTSVLKKIIGDNQQRETEEINFFMLLISVIKSFVHLLLRAATNICIYIPFLQEEPLY